MKKFIAILVSALLITSIAGCGNEKMIEKSEKGFSGNKNTIAELKTSKGKTDESSLKKNLKDKELNTKDKNSEFKKNSIKNKKRMEDEKIKKDTEMSDLVYHGEAPVTSAMFVPIGNSYVFISDDSGVFVVLGEPEVFDKNGNSIQFEELKAGNMVDITSSGIMLMSYPGQLSDTTKIQITDEGKTDDISKYQDIIDQLTINDDENEEIPVLTISYTNHSGDISVLLENDGNYNLIMGEQTKVAKGDKAYQKMYLLEEINVDEATTAMLQFSDYVENISVVKYPLNSDDMQGEEVEVEIEDTYSIEIEPAIYTVTAEFRNGTVSYSFVCKLCKSL